MSTTFGFSEATAMVAEGNIKREPQVSAVTFGAEIPVEHGSGLEVDNHKLLVFFVI